ncbi:MULTISPECIES: helix-turn-helix domain-containing protein [unclassified Haloarcula]|uniref:helix-turn-helix domain-containing protein n=1 Tax=unclassified Haloarcula TaxID=2624677 RepID=UPI000EF25BA6|nr:MULTISPECIES: helix-turn-helix domain-containing protein [unclassified Haloarcula]RLM36497.1 ArsR family transcriptional regulator [Haloarcula sp. Atlit-120R]RLM45120.1 ArsR family transcriptional regulator [Haloarcula sp. Atlit-47R]
MTPPADGPRLFECETCGGVGIGDNRPECCDGPMETVETAEAAVAEPSLETLLRTVFDMSGTELDVCLCVMEGGELTVAELAEQIGYDRSVVARHLNHLAEFGVVEKRRRIRPSGGHVYVYTPQPPEVVRERLRGEFLAWVRLATAELSDLQREKVEAIADAGTDERQWTVFQEE